MALVVDTGPFYASLDRRDADHDACRSLLENQNEILVIPAPVLVEVDYLLQKGGRSRDFVTILDNIRNKAVAVEDVTPDDYVRIREVCDRYADMDIGFVDAAVFAIVERLKEPKLATLDRRHFSVLRPQHVDALELLPG
jgi:uncharacterized protein